MYIYMYMIYVTAYISWNMYHSIEYVVYIAQDIHHGIHITGLNIPKSEMAEYYIADFCVARPGRISTTGRSQKLRT